MRQKKAEKQKQLIEAERTRLMNLSEKELLVEILITLRGISENSEDIELISTIGLFR